MHAFLKKRLLKTIFIYAYPPSTIANFQRRRIKTNYIYNTNKVYKLHRCLNYMKKKKESIQAEWDKSCISQHTSGVKILSVPV